MDIPLITLVLGETYSIVDWCGMMGFDARYRGIAKDTTTCLTPDLLVFETIDTHDIYSPFCGVIPSATFSHDYQTGDTKVTIHLRASYYGPSIDALCHVNQRNGLPKFALKHP